jgi:hypothetical protein
MRDPSGDGGGVFDAVKGIAFGQHGRFRLVVVVAAGIRLTKNGYDGD